METKTTYRKDIAVSKDEVVAYAQIVINLVKVGAKKSPEFDSALSDLRHKVNKYENAMYNFHMER